ncbi:hypothetical protein AWB74_02003 [Caballeronia arvi]|uniref:Uncharacterized protein n=1 Tax=Caballeronia arvi TaxID=1777135 RepID=A0A158HPJ2_9BURK|nr:hypothetical protein [Caballeronia arvi]SAL45841.1 hypothetical protein AWB74_02003 [Caballeronia arvi]
MSLLGNAVVLIWNDIVDEGRDGFYAWHDKEHIPERLSIDGFLRGRRYRGDDASPEWLTVYEARDLRVLTGDAYLERLDNPTPLTRASVADFRNTARSICRIAETRGESTGGYVLTMQLRVDGNVPGLARFESLLARGDVLAAHAFIADDTASNAQTAEAKARAFTVPSHIVMFEAATREGIEACRSTLDAYDWPSHGATAEPCNVYVLEISRLSANLKETTS